MTFDFDKVFHKPNSPIPEDCPCRKCDEPKYSVDNPTISLQNARNVKFIKIGGIVVNNNTCFDCI